MNKKIIIVSVVVFFLLGVASFYFSSIRQTNTRIETENQVLSTTTPQTQGTWKTYQNQELGFSIKYPSVYSIEVTPLSTSSDWLSADFIAISNPKDTSTREFHIIPVRVFLQKQPVVYGGRIFRTVKDYIQSDEYTEGEASNSKDRDKLVTINGEQAIRRHSLQGDAEDAPTDGYYFIKNDLIYQVSLNANDPYRQQILESITFLKNR